MLAQGLREPPGEFSIPLFSGNLWSSLWGVGAIDATGAASREAISELPQEGL